MCEQFHIAPEWPVLAVEDNEDRIPWFRQRLPRAVFAKNFDTIRIRHNRHSYRSWLDAVGTAIAVQQKLMRHSDIRATLNVYGDVVTDEMPKPIRSLFDWLFRTPL